MHDFETAYQTCQNDPLFAFVYSYGKIFTIRGTDHCFKNDLHLVSGSFNPLHDGHRALFNKAKEMACGEDGSFAYELSIDRTNKGTVSSDILWGRIQQFKDEGPVIISKHPLFYDKTGVLAGVPNLHFHVGIDTALRVVSAHSTVGAQGIRATFHVYPRAIEDKVWGLSDLPGDTPINFIEEEALPEHLLGISSTEIRQEMGISEIGLQGGNT